MQTIFFLMDQRITFIFWILTEKKRNKHQNHSVFSRPYPPPFPTGRTLCSTWLGDTHTLGPALVFSFIYFTMFSYISLFFEKFFYFFLFPYVCVGLPSFFFFFYLVQPFACQGTPPSFPPTPNLYPVLVRSSRSLFFYFLFFFFLKKANIQ